METWQRAIGAVVVILTTVLIMRRICRPRPRERVVPYPHNNIYPYDVVEVPGLDELADDPYQYGTVKKQP